MEIKINKEIKDYHESMFFGLSARQFICSVLAVGAAVGTYFGLRDIVGKEVVSWLCVVLAAHDYSRRGDLAAFLSNGAGLYIHKNF